MYRETPKEMITYTSVATIHSVPPKAGLIESRLPCHKLSSRGSHRVYSELADGEVNSAADWRALAEISNPAIRTGCRSGVSESFSSTLSNRDVRPSSASWALNRFFQCD